MLGEKISEESGNVTTQRVLPNPGGGPKMETTFRAVGKLLGIDVTDTGTYSAVVRPDGRLFGEGQGVSMGKDGSMASWVGSGIGTFKADGSVSYRGTLYYQTSSPAWARLNGIVGIFEYEVDAAGGTRGTIWEWK